MQSFPLPYAVQIAQALGPSIIALAALLITAYFAWKQWSTARDRLRLDLFDKRYAYFVVFREFMISVIQHGDATNDDLRKFWQGMIGSEFVFDKEVTEYVESVRKRAELLRSKNRILENIDNGEARARMADEVSSIFLSINDDFPLLEQKFAKSMNLGSM
ncbi:hypothetical protein [Bradyrhizobium sp. G127]|uniref:hypothetical protein n=1 Tax=Bradyrhizobium sp. G127 TaxID=2904800 RepID=UPI001F429312|nr:hypothetical protein [Bradyrhizobium sp. G127]MCF2521911.1 hypothetical protein [Bradyrhizobium sp. G127]